MGNTINLSETLIISLGSMAIVLAILIVFAISLVIKLLKMGTESHQKSNAEYSSVQNPISNSVVAQSSVQNFNDNDNDDEEDRLVAVLAASALTAQSRPDSHFRVSKITRIK